jgi:hypothetical protein
MSRYKGICARTATPRGAWRNFGGGESLDTITTLMYQNSTLIGAIILVGVLVYIGVNGISPRHIRIRRIVAFCIGCALVIIGAFEFYFGASKEWEMLQSHIYQSDTFRLEWALVGVIAFITGILLVRQSHRDM